MKFRKPIFMTHSAQFILFLTIVQRWNHKTLLFTWRGVQHSAKAMITTMIILVTLILFSLPLHLFRVSRAGPGPWVAALPRQSRSSMFMYSHRMLNKGSANIVTNTTTYDKNLKLNFLQIWSLNNTANIMNVTQSKSKMQ